MELAQMGDQNWDSEHQCFVVVFFSNFLEGVNPFVDSLLDTCCWVWFSVLVGMIRHLCNGFFRFENFTRRWVLLGAEFHHSYIAFQNQRRSKVD